MAASATFALKAGVWFRRGRLFMVSPDSQATACPPSGRNSTYRPVQISGASSDAENFKYLWLVLVTPSAVYFRPFASLTSARYFSRSLAACLVSVRRLLESAESLGFDGAHLDSREGLPLWTDKNRAR